ncbi:MAG: hypothetical protein IH905_14660, partial [Proteobacteria bacterium]|nr:hypothetical protein [Pseudomonadota bacterium]
SLDGEQREYVESIRKSGNALLTIINDILDFSKIEAGKLDLEFIDFDLRTTMEEVADLLAFKAEDKGLSFSCFLHPQVEGFVNGDPGRLKQILINLVVNAMESITATDRPDGEIEIVIENETFVGREWVHVQVKDNGRGIDGATLIDIFQRGFSTKEGKKRGFGLHWCANTLVAMNGRIEAASKGIAKGAVFHIYLPTEREVARAA